MATASQIPPFKPKAQRPPFIPYDTQNLENTAIEYGNQTAQATTALRNRQNPGWAQALKAGQQNILNTEKGDSTLTPLLQSEAIRAGLGDAGASLGDIGDGSLTPGSAATEKVSTDLFGTANTLDQQIRQNQLQALQVGSAVYPDTQMGLSGTDAATIAGANTLGVNSFNESNYEDQLENERLNWRVQAENVMAQTQQQNINAQASAQAGAAKQGALIQGGAAVAGIAVLAIAL